MVDEFVDILQNEFFLALYKPDWFLIGIVVFASLFLYSGEVKLLDYIAGMFSPIANSL